MIASLSQSQAELPRLVELASKGEDVLITIDGQPKAKLTRVGNGVPLEGTMRDLTQWLAELDDLRHAYCTGQAGRTVEQILEEDRADRL